MAVDVRKTLPLGEEVLGWLVPQNGPSEGTVVQLRAHFTIGSDRACHLVLDDTSVAPQHARITLQAKGYAVEDLGSPGGTWVNHTPVQRGQRDHLVDRDLLRFGRITVMFKCM